MFTPHMNLAQGVVQAASEQEAQLIAVLKSDAGQKEKADACRELARIGTRNAVPALAALLVDEKMTHMARYGLETISHASVDEALRDALGKVKGRMLAGVIGSLGVRHDAKAVDALAERLLDSDPIVAQAAARALGRIADAAAIKALDGALDQTPEGNKVAFCEGLFRCAEAQADQKKTKEALAIYDRLRPLKGPHQVRTAALRGAVMLRENEGIPLLMEAIRSDDFALVQGAARIAQEIPGAAVTKAFSDELSKLSTDKQILLLQTMGKRADKGALPALSAAAKSGEKAVRLAAVLALPQLGDPSAATMLQALAKDADEDVANAAKNGLSALSGM